MRTRTPPRSPPLSGAFSGSSFAPSAGGGRLRQRDADGKGGAGALGAAALNAAVHQVHHAPDDGKAEASALNFVDAAVGNTGEGVVHGFLELLRHSDARILDHADRHGLAVRSGLLADLHADAAAGVCILDGVMSRFR